MCMYAFKQFYASQKSFLFLFLFISLKMISILMHQKTQMRFILGQVY
jgi:hypothetical protein